MSGHGKHTPAEIRAKLNHPVIDGDGHWVEYDPVFAEQMRKVGGDLAADGFLKAMAVTRDSLMLSVAERKRRRVSMPGFWTRQTGNTLDRATAMIPHMLYDRLDEIGSDFAVVYPTAGLRLPRIKDDATRRAVIRAYNIVSADYFDGLGDRLTPAAIIPMHSPEEAIAELEFVTSQLGSKVGMFGSGMSRALPDATGNATVHYDVLRSTASTITTRSGPNASNSTSRRPFIRAPAARGCATRRPILSTTISAISPPPVTPCRRRSFWAASQGASRNCASRFSKAGSAGRRSSGAI